MAIAHKLKKNYAAFSSVLVAGAISIFYFTISIAFHDYHLFSQTVAFAIMVVITAFSTFVSVAYNRQELAVLSLIGGFAVPFMVSTGEGNYVVLFTYIAILNIGILGIAYFKKWNIVTILSFVFTNLLLFSWYNKELYADFFLQGWWKHYNGNFNEYKTAKQNGWVHTNSGFLARASDTQKIIQKAQDKLNKLLIFKSFAAIGFEPMTVEHESTEITRLLHTA